jgi:hypothetical protein
METPLTQPFLFAGKSLPKDELKNEGSKLKLFLEVSIAKKSGKKRSIKLPDFYIGFCY